MAGSVETPLGAPEELTFASGGEECAAWVFRPSGPRDGVPCVILGHGFSLVREGRLDAYAERFAAAGLAAVVFDYRYFGASGGRPRELLSIEAQQADWRAAVAFARELDGVDGERIALWGTSLSGGHVVPVALADGAIAAVVSQVPFAGLGGRSGPPRPVHTVALIAAALRDELAGRLGRGPAYIPVVSEAGEFAAFDGPGAAETIVTLLPAESNWRNRYTPRVILRMARYKPFEGVAGLRAPWLLCLADDDEITPADLAAERAAEAPRHELRRYATTHFGVYTGAWFERVVEDQTAFLRRHLLDGG